MSQVEGQLVHHLPQNCTRGPPIIREFGVDTYVSWQPLKPRLFYPSKLENNARVSTEQPN